MELLIEVKSYLLDLDEEYRGTENLEDTTFEVLHHYKNASKLIYSWSFTGPLFQLVTGI